jgi:outer membrane lipoprotein SlyB
METQTSNSPHPLMWLAGIALIVFCGAGVAAIMGWIPTSMGKADEFPQAKVEQSPHKAAVVKAPVAHAAPVAVAAAKCAECGVIQSVREIEAKGEGGSGVGAVGGAVVGGVLGHQVGHGDGTTIATVLGAVGGAVAGNEIEKRVKTSKTYEVTVLLENGSTRVFTEAAAPAWRNGDKVKIVNGAIQSNA